MKPTARYRETRENGSNPSRYTFQIEFSDDPGSTVMYGLTADGCEQEVNAARAMGYTVSSDVYRAA